MSFNFKEKVLVNTNPSDLEILTTKSIDVDESEYKHLIKARDFMLNMMDTHRGVGLAAPQVGVLKRMLVMKLRVGGFVFMANPTIIKKSSLTTFDKEGCLSLPGKRKKKIRSRQVKVSYINEIGQPLEQILHGMDAICFQHEFDHLEGKLL